MQSQDGDDGISFVRKFLCFYKSQVFREAASLLKLNSKSHVLLLSRNKTLQYLLHTSALLFYYKINKSCACKLKILKIKYYLDYDLIMFSGPKMEMYYIFGKTWWISLSAYYQLRGSPCPFPLCSEGLIPTQYK